MESFVVDTSRLVSDVIGCIAELKNRFQSSGRPINDDDAVLQRFCVKLETTLRHEQKEKYTFLGIRKDYWNFISEIVPKDDGVKYVQMIPQMKTPQGKGRCFIRYALVKQTLADTVQRLTVSQNALSSWYRQDAILRNLSLSTALINKLYDLNDVEFDLPSAGYELDISWPAFSRRTLKDGSTSGRRGSTSSMTSVDFRNERRDPLIDLASEITSLQKVVNNDHTTEQERKASVSASSTESPTVTELTLQISNIHKQVLKWKANVDTQRAVTAHELKKAQDDREYAIRECELKTKQLTEKYSNLANAAANQWETKCMQLTNKLTQAEASLQGRDSELRELRNEINRSVVNSSTAQEAAIGLKRELLESDRKSKDLESEIKNLKFKIQSHGELESEFEVKEKRFNDRLAMYESREFEYKGTILELNGTLKAKEVALKSIQETFEKLSGMVFGSFEELEAQMKERLNDREKGLQNQTLENRKLELYVVELQQKLREVNEQLSQTKSNVKDMETLRKDTESDNSQMQAILEERDKTEMEFLAFLKKLWTILVTNENGREMKGGLQENQHTITNNAQTLTNTVKSLQNQLTDISDKFQEIQHTCKDQEENGIKTNSDLESLQITNNTLVEDLNKLQQVRNDLFENENSLQEQLKTLSSEVADLKTELSQAKHRYTSSKQELAHCKDNIQTHVSVIEEYKRQEISLQNQVQLNENSSESTRKELGESYEKMIGLTLENQTSKENIISLNDEVKCLADKMAALEDELELNKEQLESTIEDKMRTEAAQVKTQDELENFKSLMDQEVAALKFQLSSETIKFETEKKVFSELSQESARHKERSAEQEEAIADLESKLKERSDEWQKEKRKYVNEVKRLRSEIQLLKNALDGNKQNVMKLENELLLTTKQLEEERSRQKELKQKMHDLEAKKMDGEKEFQDKINEMADDMKDLKGKIVSLTREKAELWEKADEFEQELKVKATDRWVEDGEVKQCTSCKSEFSFLLRKHHCRLCGRIFCHSCVNNWVRTAHSSKSKRVCNHCLASDQRLKPQQRPRHRNDTDADEDFDETMSDISFVTSPRKDTSRSIDDEQLLSPAPSTSQASSYEGQLDGFPASPKATSSIKETPKPLKRTKEVNIHDNNSSNMNLSVGDVKTAESTSTNQERRQLSPDGEDYEFIDPSKETSDGSLSSVTISDVDIKADLVIPAVNDDQGVSRDATIPPGTRYIIPVMVATPGTILCWSFKTLYKSIIYGLAYKKSETLSDETIETLYPLARFSSNETTVEGEWKTTSHGVYILVFDNSFSRFTSKQLSCMVHVKRRPSIRL